MSTMSAATVRPTPRLGSTRRESYLEWIRERYPTFKPENDYEIVSLVQGNCSAPESELRSLLDKQLLLDIKFALGLESLEAVMLLHPAEADRAFQRFIWHARTILDAPGTLARVSGRFFCLGRHAGLTRWSPAARCCRR